jgi:hypothetical protein
MEIQLGQMKKIDPYSLYGQSNQTAMFMNHSVVIGQQRNQLAKMLYIFLSHLYSLNQQLMKMNQLRIQWLESTM